jgi:hypothetical protein
METRVLYFYHQCEFCDHAVSMQVNYPGVMPNRHLKMVQQVYAPYVTRDGARLWRHIDEVDLVDKARNFPNPHACNKVGKCVGSGVELKDGERTSVFASTQTCCHPGMVERAVLLALRGEGGEGLGTRHSSYRLIVTVVPHNHGYRHVSAHHANGFVDMVNDVMSFINIIPVSVVMGVSYGAAFDRRSKPLSPLSSSVALNLGIIGDQAFEGGVLTLAEENPHLTLPNVRRSHAWEWVEREFIDYDYYPMTSNVKGLRDATPVVMRYPRPNDLLWVVGRLGIDHESKQLVEVPEEGDFGYDQYILEDVHHDPDRESKDPTPTIHSLDSISVVTTVDEIDRTIDPLLPFLPRDVVKMIAGYFAD